MLLSSLFGIEMNIDPMFLILGYAGMTIYVLTRLEKARRQEGFVFKNWIKDNFLTIIISFILVPIMLLVCTDTSLKDILPINKVTAFLAGYQTKDILNTLLNVTRMKTSNT